MKGSLCALGEALVGTMLGDASWSAQPLDRTGHQAPGAMAPRRRPAADVARGLLARAGLSDVAVRRAGQAFGSFRLSDQTLALSNDLAGSSGVLALAVVAHEVGHALQLRERRWLATLSRGLGAGTVVGMTLALLALLDGSLAGAPGLVGVGLAGGGASVLLAAATTLTELGASRRGRASLLAVVALDAAEVATLRRLLLAAALTYLATPLLALRLLAITLACAPAPADRSGELPST